MKYTPITQFSKEQIKQYSRVHKWLVYQYGPADTCQNPDCPKQCKKYEWALKPNKEYEHNSNNFLQLCVLCHRSMDFKIRMASGQEFHLSKIPQRTCLNCKKSYVPTSPTQRFCGNRSKKQGCSYQHLLLVWRTKESKKSSLIKTLREGE